MDLQAPLSVTHNSSAANAPAVPLPVAGLPPRSRRRSNRAANVAQGASADGGVHVCSSASSTSHAYASVLEPPNRTAAMLANRTQGPVLDVALGKRG